MNINSKERYNIFYITLHWLMAFIIIFLFILGYYMKSIPFNPTFYFIHKSFGVLVFILAVLRLLGRIFFTMPTASKVESKFVQILASLSIVGLYGFMIFMPLSGALYSLYYGKSVSLFGIVAIPAFTQNLQIAHIFEEIHEIMAVFFISLIAIHILGALFHQFILKDNIFGRIFFLRKQQSK